MQTTEYVAARNATDFERERLSLLEQISDPRTHDRMEAIGVTSGWRCLEVGAGAGSVVRWLADRTAPTGRVVATDIDTRFLESLDLPGVEVRQHNILTDDLENDVFDLAHCRALLLHLPERELALRRMYDAVRPGGWLFVEDLDVTTMRAADPTHPYADDFEALQERTVGFFGSIGVFDPSNGRRVRGMLEDLGLEGFDHVGTTAVLRGGEPAAHFMALGAQMTRPLLVSQGVATEEEMDREIEMFEDPGFSFTDSVTYQYWGRKPADRGD